MTLGDPFKAERRDKHSNQKALSSGKIRLTVGLTRDIVSGQQEAIPRGNTAMRMPYETPAVTTLEASSIIENLGPAQSLSSGGGGGGVSGDGPSSVIGGGSSRFGR